MRSLPLLHEKNATAAERTAYSTKGVQRDRRDLLEILEDRYDRRSTVVTSQLPVATWHDAFGDATLADAVLDRLVHNAHELRLKGESRARTRHPSQRMNHHDEHHEAIAARCRA